MDGKANWSSIACKATMVGHTDSVRCLDVNGDRVISGSYDNSLKVWDINSGQCTKTLRYFNYLVKNLFVLRFFICGYIIKRADNYSIYDKNLLFACFTCNP